jgi:hypothetical protein
MANRIIHIAEDGSKSWLTDYDHETGGVMSVERLRECAERLDGAAVEIDAGEFDAGELDADYYRELAADYRALIAMREQGVSDGVGRSQLDS